MHFLIIGGTRFVGLSLVQRLLDRGDQVTVLTRGRAKAPWQDRVEHVLLDRSNRQDFARALAGRQFDCVIDMVALGGRPDVEAADQTFFGNIGRYILISSTSVYADLGIDFRKHCPFPESIVDWSSLAYSPPEGVPGVSTYAPRKRDCEKWLIESGRLDFTIVRLPAVVGPLDYSRRLWWWVQRAMDGGPVLVPDDNRACFRVVYSEDVAENLIRAALCRNSSRGVYNLCGIDILDDQRWTDGIWTALGKTCDRVYMPLDVIHNHPKLKEYSPLMIRAAPYVPDIGRAAGAWDLVSTPFDEWIKPSVKWFRDDYNGFPERQFDSPGYDVRAAEIELAAKWRDEFGAFVQRL